MVMERLIRLLAAHFSCRPDEIHPNSVIGADNAEFEIDSIDIIAILHALEQEFKIEIDDEAVEHWYDGVTVQELHDYLVTTYPHLRSEHPPQEF